MTRTVAVVAHTHWDREWYATHESFRARLVDALDALLQLLDADPAYRGFLLDGQMAMVDDYLALRPEAEERIRRLAGAGRLAVGPWYVLMDEFEVSGETIVRNLQLGLARAEAFGGAMPVGYLPDMFGHVAQMPQLLRQAGFADAVVWRGVPAAVDRTGFTWVAPDGSSVRAEYLPVGYANGAYLPGDAERLVRRVAAHEVEIGRFLATPETPLLLMNGTDHQRPQPGLPGLLAAANAAQDGFRFEQVSLADYLADRPADGRPEWRGELRSGARANLLMGVGSNRVDIKQAAAAAERALERVAEPLCALWRPAEDWPDRVLDEAWLQMIHNSAHDSICACSADEVVRAVAHRYEVARGLAAEATRAALDLAALAVDADGPVVVNPTARDVSALVELTIPATTAAGDVQVIATTPAATEERTATGAELGRLLGELIADGWLPGGRGTRAAIDRRPDRVELRLDSDPTAAPAPDVPSVMAEAYAVAGAAAAEPLTVTVRRPATQRVLARVAVPGYGWAAWRPVPGPGDPHPGREADGAAHGGVPDGADGGDGWIGNDRVTVRVDPALGTFSLRAAGQPADAVAGLDRLVDGGDEGDTYNYSPPADDIEVDRPDTVEVTTVETGPLRARLRVRRRFTWPVEVRRGARAGARPVTVETELEVRAGDPLVRVVTRFDNQCRDHRLRTVLPLPRRAGRSRAECAFGTVERGDAEGGPHERAVATWPSRRFVTAGGLTVVHDGLLEYELVGDGSALALTLLRATGFLSRPAPAWRPNPAGPALPLEDAQLIGRRTARYGVALSGDPWRLAEEAWLSFPVVSGTPGGPLPSRGRRLRVEGGQASALRRVEGALELRVFNPAPEPETVRVVGHRGWLVDLAGRPLGPWDGTIALGPGQIATARFDDAPLGQS